jgi:hypothetical protein
VRHRRRSVALGGLLVVGCSLLVLRGGARRPPSNGAVVLGGASALPLPVVSRPFVVDAIVPPSPTPEAPRLPRAQALPPKAPRRVRFGVILVQYRGVQHAPDSERSRSEAFTLAERLAAVGRVDFARAVQQGDEGSIADAGHMDRGILEPGAVSRPLDTPRGFWVVRRIE